MLTYATTFQPLPEEAGASQESWRIWLQSSLFLFVLITALVLKRLASSPATQILLLLSPFSISFNSPFGHSPDFQGVVQETDLWYNNCKTATIPELWLGRCAGRACSRLDGQ